MTAHASVPGSSNALFVLACGCTLDGFHDCDPARKWAAGVRNGVLYCSRRRHGWRRLTDVVSIDPLPVPATVPSPDRSQP